MSDIKSFFMDVDNPAALQGKIPIGIPPETGLIQKHVNRHAWLLANKEAVCARLGVGTEYQIVSACHIKRCTSNQISIISSHTYYLLLRDKKVWPVSMVPFPLNSLAPPSLTSVEGLQRQI